MLSRADRGQTLATDQVPARGVAPKRDLARGLMIRMGTVDQASIACAIAVGLVYWVCAGAGLRLWQVDPIWQSVWLPNAGVVAFLLLVRLRNEIPLLAAMTGASV